MRVDVSDLMSDADLGGTTFTRRRPASDGTYADTSIAGIIQPAATADAQLLPDGVRLSDVQKFFANADLSPGNGRDSLPDLLLDDAGNTYRVLHVQAFGKHGMTSALAQRLFPGTPVTP